MEKHFVRQDSVVRRIWGDADVILLIFAGSAAEFALNRAVDWLFFTGRLPADPIARLFSTVRYAQEIVFAPEVQANQAIARMGAIHGGVENKRGYKIPDWAYRDVLVLPPLELLLLGALVVLPGLLQSLQLQRVLLLVLFAQPLRL